MTVVGVIGVLLSLSLAVDFMSAVTRLMCAVGRAGDIGNVIKSDLPLTGGEPTCGRDQCGGGGRPNNMTSCQMGEANWPR